MNSGGLPGGSISRNAVGSRRKSSSRLCRKYSGWLAIHKTLYFSSDGGKGLAAFLHQRVRATGTVTEKTEPMELTMPVGEHNQMIVRVEGGYKVIAIATVAAAPAPVK